MLTHEQVYGLQLGIGVVSMMLWLTAFLIARRRRVLPAGLLLSGMVGFLAAQVVLVFGSLFLLGLATPQQWDVVGTGIRGVVALSGVGAVIAAATEEDILR